MTTLRWADYWTRQGIMNAVMSKLSTQDHIDVRHVLDRNALHRCMGTRADYQERLEESLRVDAMNEEYPL